MPRGDPKLRDFTKLDKETLKEIAKEAEEKTDELIRITKMILAAEGTNKITPDIAKTVVAVAKGEKKLSEFAPSTLQPFAEEVGFALPLQKTLLAHTNGDVHGNMILIIDSSLFEIGLRQHCEVVLRARGFSPGYQNILTYEVKDVLGGIKNVKNPGAYC